ncbi:hypothetical protein Suden_1632 [Sulfurimonas denitrificans DSM 1251]|uniref:Uncharacterized protein n=1 Tax=Sulfurimonas denitrificans (strain ATCC 33889 / DSM 1251) TaxID=326298 RepID=Q30Q22_SULDN|nr:hypothetical protein [Sulfurimonas denitrificans]ABB44909.1 hypothetical protein Suden_1632 [Sulfurimonas denitrificans DSM 1251]
MSSYATIFSQILEISEKSFYRWKNKDHVVLVTLLEKYFTKEDLEEFFESGKIERLDFFKKLDSFFNSFSLQIEQKMSLKLNITNNNYSFGELDEYVSLFFLRQKELKIEDLQLKILKYISDDDKLSSDRKISYIAAISSLNEIEFFIISKELFLLKI